jgi:AraC-like DNA-binding protein
MVKIGQIEQTPASPIEPVRFARPHRPGFGLEVMTLAELRRRVPPHHRRIHSRPEFHQLMLIESGRLEHEVDFERYRCGPGSVLHVRAGQVQRFLRDTGSRGWALLFTPEFLPSDLALQAALGPGGLVAFAVPPADRAAVGPTVRALVAAGGQNDVGAEVLPVVRHLLAALLLMLARASEAVSGRRMRRPVAASRLHDRFIHELERSFASSRSAEDYARRIGTSGKSLARACRATAGLTPKQLIERRVALEAKRLLAHSRLSVLAIGTELGFSESTNFIKFFRRSEGMTPLAFRERFRSD